MTPLAMHIWEQKRLPIAQRTFDDQHQLLSRLDDFHCFDKTEVQDLVLTMANTMFNSREWPQELLFLPAPKTWLEDSRDGNVLAYFLQQAGVDRAKLTLVGPTNASEHFGFIPLGEPLARRLIVLSAEKSICIDERREFQRDDEALILALTAAALVLINGPGLCPQRKLHHSRPVAKRLGLRVNGSFPLLAWTELTLRVGEGEQKSWTGGRQGGRTDMMPLHFVRAHRRRINGEWRKIEAFWRGNAALGIKQTRYKVKPRGSSNGS